MLLKNFSVSQIRTVLCVFLSGLLVAQTLPVQADEGAPSFSIVVPAAAGFVSDAYTPSRSARAPDFIFIQNLHVNRSAQFSITRILSRLHTQGVLPVRLGIEGVSGPLDISDMQRYGDANRRHQASDYLVRQGEMPGVMHFAVNAGGYQLYGVESENLYQANLEVFRRSYGPSGQVIRELTGIQEALPRIRRAGLARKNAAILRKDVPALLAVLNHDVVPDELSQTMRQAVQGLQRLQTVLPEKESAKLLQAVSDSANFYALARLRDEALFTNALTLRKADHQSTTVLVTGGFHTAGFAERCRKQGFSYVVITPVVNEHNSIDRQLYIDRLLGGHFTSQQLADGRDWASLQATLEAPLGNVMASLEAAGAGIGRRASHGALLAATAVTALLSALGCSPAPMAPKVDTPVVVVATDTSTKLENLPKTGVHIVHYKGVTYLDVRGHLLSGIPAVAYQPVPDDNTIHNFENGQFASLYKALLPPDGQGIDAAKYPDLIALARQPGGAPASDHAKILAAAGYKMIRTYNISVTTAADLRLVSQIFRWMHEKYGILFTAGMYNPSVAEAEAAVQILSNNPGLAFYDIFNEANYERNVPYSLIQQVTAAIQKADSEHPVALALSRLGLPGVKTIGDLTVDAINLTIYDETPAQMVAEVRGAAGFYTPKAIGIGEWGIPTDLAETERARQMADIAAALITTDISKPSPAYVVTVFEGFRERWKGTDNRWWIYATPSWETLAAVNYRWVPGPTVPGAAALNVVPLPEVELPVTPGASAEKQTYKKFGGVKKGLLIKGAIYSLMGMVGLSSVSGAQSSVLPKLAGPALTGTSHMSVMLITAAVLGLIGFFTALYLHMRHQTELAHAMSVQLERVDFQNMTLQTDNMARGIAKYMPSWMRERLGRNVDEVPAEKRRIFRLVQAVAA